MNMIKQYTKDIAFKIGKALIDFAQTPDTPTAAAPIPTGHTLPPAPPPHRIWVNSSAVRSVGYDVETRVLEVEWNSGAIYQYADVPRSEYRALMESPSLGRFIAGKIKPFYAAKGPLNR